MGLILKSARCSALTSWAEQSVSTLTDSVAQTLIQQFHINTLILGLFLQLQTYFMLTIFTSTG